MNRRKNRDSEKALALAGAAPTMSDEHRDNLYFYDSLVTFKVEDCLFRVPPEAFETESTVFNDMFSLAHAGDEGEPIELQQVSKEAFRDLLCIIYPRTIHSHSTQASDLRNWSKDRILSVLELAHMWDFGRVKKMLAELLDAVYEVTKPLLDNAIDEILFLQKYGLRSRYLDAYARLLVRKTPISLKEAEKIGMKFILRLSHVREAFQAHKANTYRLQLEALRKDIANTDVAQGLNNKSQGSSFSHFFSLVTWIGGLCSGTNETVDDGLHAQALEFVKSYILRASYM